MGLGFELVDPRVYPGWDDLVRSTPGGSFFHSSSWIKVLSESYHYKPLFFSRIEQGRLTDLIPLMEVNSVFTGKRAVSLPFSDYCEPILSGRTTFRTLFSELLTYGKRVGWKSFELRGAEGVPQDWKFSAQYRKHTLNLTRGEARLFSECRSSTKRNVKKAEREGVRVYRSNSVESLGAFYRLNCMTRKRHGLPPQPYYFFKQLFKQVLSKDHGAIMLAEYENNIIAGAVYFHFGEKVTYKYGASDDRFQHLRANNLIMWEAIKWYCNQACYKTFCFGRTSLQNKGLLQFKTGWGAKESELKYYIFDFSKNTFQNDHFEVSARLQSLFKYMPIPLLKMVSLLSYKHIG